MSVDLQNETVQTFPQAAKLFPIVPHVATVARWAFKGVRGVKLEYGRSGRRLFTTTEAVNRFVNALADADNPVDAPAPSVRRPSQSRREKEIQAAEKFCASRGL